jgi:5-oxopent-3-ene-1,2,5-tricarboxylate decarboxylase/2-hydroxyhepta-2,4-diene-1,7-dioate isomerase
MPARPAMSGTVYGVILNDICTVQRMGQSLDDAPYKGAPKAPVLYIKPAGTRVPGGSMVSLPEGAAAVEVGATVGLVMGQAAARLSVETALEAVAGGGAGRRPEPAPRQLLPPGRPRKMLRRRAAAGAGAAP